MCSEVVIICESAWRFFCLLSVSLQSNKNKTIVLQNLHKTSTVMSQNCYYDLKMCSINIWTGAPWWTGGTPKPFKSRKSPTNSAFSPSNLTRVLTKPPGEIFLPRPGFQHRPIRVVSADTADSWGLIALVCESMEEPQLIWFVWSVKWCVLGVDW